MVLNLTKEAEYLNNYITSCKNIGGFSQYLGNNNSFKKLTSDIIGLQSKNKDYGLFAIIESHTNSYLSPNIMESFINLIKRTFWDDNLIFSKNINISEFQEKFNIFKSEWDRIIKKYHMDSFSHFKESHNLIELEDFSFSLMIKKNDEYLITVFGKTAILFDFKGRILPVEYDDIIKKLKLKEKDKIKHINSVFSKLELCSLQDIIRENYGNYLQSETNRDDYSYLNFIILIDSKINSYKLWDIEYSFSQTYLFYDDIQQLPYNFLESLQITQTDKFIKNTSMIIWVNPKSSRTEDLGIYNSFPFFTHHKKDEPYYNKLMNVLYYKEKFDSKSDYIKDCFHHSLKEILFDLYKETKIDFNQSFLGGHTTKKPSRLSTYNEDAVLYHSSNDGKFSMMVIADGVGSSFGARFASNFLVSLASKYFWFDENEFEELSKSSNEDIIKSLELLSQYFIEDAMNELDFKYSEIINNDSTKKINVFQTTIVLAIVIDGRIFYTWLGDSYIFAIINGRLIPLNFIHTNNLFKNIKDIENISDDKLRSLLEKSVSERGGAILYYLGANLPFRPKLKWFNLTEILKIAYPELILKNSNSHTCNLDYLVLQSDGLVDLFEIWYIEELLLERLLVSNHPYYTSLEILNMVLEVAIDDMSLIIWQNPKFNIESYGFNYSNLIKSYFDLIQYTINNQIFEHLKQFKDKENKYTKDESIHSYIKDCVINPLRIYIEDFLKFNNSIFEKREIEK